MGRKNRNKTEEDELAPEQAKNDDSKKYMSLKALGKKEAEMANQGKAKNTKNEDDFSDEDGQAKKKNKRTKKGGKQQDEEFGDNEIEEPKKGKKDKKKNDDSDDDVPVVVAASKKSKKDKKKNDSESEEEVIHAKDSKKSKKQQKQQDSENDSADEDDIKNQIEDHFEGVGKKNTRKKKNKNAQEDNLMDAVFDEGADSDEVHARKGTKGGKKGEDKKKHQGKKKNKKQSDDEDEEAEEEKVEVKEEKGKGGKKVTKVEEVKEEPVGLHGLPLEIIYCKKCGLPPEYCTFGQKDATACKDWLKETHNDLFVELYPGEANEVVAKDKKQNNKSDAKKTGDIQAEDEKKEGEDEEEVPKPKEKKKVKFNKNEGLVTITKLARGGKKTICQIVGLEFYTKDLKSIASKFGKKFSCGSSVAMDDIYGECVSVQGDIEDKLLDYLEQDKDMIALNIPFEKIIFEEKGNKKGRKAK